MHADGFETLAIHAGQEPDPVTGAVVPPIYQVSTYKQDGVGGLRGAALGAGGGSGGGAARRVGSHRDSREADPAPGAPGGGLAGPAGRGRGLAFAARRGAAD